MNTNEIRFYLHNFDNLKKETRHLQDALEQYRRMDISGIKATVITDMPISHNDTSKTETMATTRVDYIKDLEDEIDSKMRLIRATEGVYFYLGEPHRTIIEMRYFITPMINDIRRPKYNWHEISIDVKQTENQCKKIDGRIVRKIQHKLSPKK